MKYTLLVFIMIVVLLQSCSKSTPSGTTTTTTGGGTGPGGGGGTGPGGTGPGGTGSTYVIKTRGINASALVLNASGLINNVEFTSLAGTYLQMNNAGSGMKIEIMNADSEPSVGLSGGVVYAFYPNTRIGSVASVTDADTTLTGSNKKIWFRVKGLNRAVDGCDQANFVLTDDGSADHGRIFDFSASTTAGLNNAKITNAYNNSTTLIKSGTCMIRP